MLRVLAGIGGVVALLIAAVLTSGGALLAPVGMAVAGIIARQRHDGISRRASWAGAVLAVGVALIIVGSLIVARVPTRTFTDIQHSVDSASVSRKPPAWLERVAPGASTSAVRSSQSGGWARVASIWGTVTGIVFTVVFLAVAIGTLGWAASLPLAYALTGGWLSVPRSDKRPAFDDA